MLHNPLTPQQLRHRQLTESRAWGPFSDREWANLNSEAPRKRREAMPPDFTPYIRRVPADVILEDLKTVLMEGE